MYFFVDNFVSVNVCLCVCLCRQLIDSIFYRMSKKEFEKDIFSETPCICTCQCIFFVCAYGLVLSETLSKWVFTKKYLLFVLGVDVCL